VKNINSNFERLFTRKAYDTGMDSADSIFVVLSVKNEK
jgi:hypothetical protein